MRLKKSIFTKLIGSFVLYVVVMIVTFVLCLVLEAMLIGEGNPTSIYPYTIIDENGNVGSIESLQKIGGWVEELEEGGPDGEKGLSGGEQDGLYHVTRVYGEKKTGEESYSAQDLLKLTSPYEETEYIGFFVQPQNSPKKYLCFYDRTVMQISTTLILNNIGEYGTPNIFPIFFPISILEMVLICLYLKRKIKNPLDQIMAGMECLKASLSSTDQGSIADGSAICGNAESSETGKSGVRINIKTEAEFEKIVETFNLMAQQLEEEKNQKEYLTRKKNQMLLELSHDIRTPIATIKSYAKALEEGLVPGERTESVYRTIGSKADRVEKLSDDMFTMLKMDNPGYELHTETIDLCEFLRQLCAECYDEITEAGFGFMIDIPDGKIMVSADISLFSRVVANLLSNAIRYNRTGETVAVSLSWEWGKALLAVFDDGEEIDEAFAGQMFQAFSRGDLSRKTDGGTGLGLAISKIIVEKHGGSIGYRRRDGKNEFVVELPTRSALPEGDTGNECPSDTENR